MTRVVVDTRAGRVRVGRHQSSPPPPRTLASSYVACACHASHYAAPLWSLSTAVVIARAAVARSYRRQRRSCLNYSTHLSPSLLCALLTLCRCDQRDLCCRSRVPAGRASQEVAEGLFELWYNSLIKDSLLLKDFKGNVIVYNGDISKSSLRRDN